MRTNFMPSRQQEEAEQLYLRSLSLNPNQPQVLVNLGNLVRPQGRLDAAALCYREAVRLQPDYKLAYFHLAAVLHQSGALEESEKNYRLVLGLDPSDTDARIALAALLNEQKKYAEAEKELNGLAAKSQDPQFLAALEYNLGVARNGQSDHAGAITHFDRALVHVPGNTAAHHSKGDALQNLGREEEAVEAFRRAIAFDPLNFGAHRDLVQLLYRLRRDDEILKSYDEAARAAPQVWQFPVAKASFLQFRQRDEEALEILERLRTAAPDNSDIFNAIGPDLFNAIGIANLNLKRFGASVAAFEKGLALSPNSPPMLTGLAGTLLASGDGQKAAMMAERALSITPHDQTALAILGSAWRLMNDPREFELNGYDSFIRAYDLDPPAGYADMESFNHDLDAYLNGLHPEALEYADQSVRGGTQTRGNIFEGNHNLVNLLRIRIEECVGRYIREMKEDARHPFLSRQLNSFRFIRCWSSRLKDCGYHTNHIHPEGWISSAYYIALPPVDDAGSRAGWIKFGEPSYELGLSEPVRRAIQPNSGRLVLFPSYMWHGTVPFRSTLSRTTLAFDVFPDKA